MPAFLDLIIGRKGDSLTGTVLEKAFTIRSTFGPITVKKKEITWIHFLNPPEFKQDEIWLKNCDRLSGVLKANNITFKTNEGVTMKIPRKKIHTIAIGQKMKIRGKLL
jgi:hypothetical protein